MFKKLKEVEENNNNKLKKILPKFYKSISHQIQTLLIKCVV